MGDEVITSQSEPGHISVPTVKVKLLKFKKAEAIINASDFDENLHERVDEEGASKRGRKKLEPKDPPAAEKDESEEPDEEEDDEDEA